MTLEQDKQRLTNVQNEKTINDKIVTDVATPTIKTPYYDCLWLKEWLEAFKGIQDKQNLHSMFLLYRFSTARVDEQIKTGVPSPSISMLQCREIHQATRVYRTPSLGVRMTKHIPNFRVVFV